MKKNKFAVFLFMAVLLLLVSCGIKGPPLPPLETVGERANNANLDPKTPVLTSGDATKTKVK